VFFKITRMDGTDCYSGRLQYEVGKPTTDPQYDGKPRIGNGIHACYKPEQCMEYRNGQWPVRLFEVGFDEHVEVQHDKVKGRTVTPIRELKLAEVFGPNGEKVMAQIDRISKIRWLKPEKENRTKVAALIQEHCRHLKKFGCPQDVAVKFTDDWDAARDAARAAAWAAAWAAARDAAWAAARDAAWAAARDAAWAAARDAAWAAAWAAAWDAAWDAAHIIVEDKVDFGNPWAPLVEICELGYLPICMTKDGHFLAYEPKMKEDNTNGKHHR
jgi:hypothetical protein